MASNSSLNERGFSAESIERQLAHKAPGVRGIYSKTQHLPERRTMKQAWADHLDALRAGGAKSCNQYAQDFRSLVAIERLTGRVTVTV